jgi:hypothetical protein
MGKRRSARLEHQRLAVANEAARIMREEGVRDYLLAKRKAAQRLGITDRGALPGNDQIAALVAEQQRLFGGDGYHSRLRELREIALEALGLFHGFEPRVVGGVLTGAVTDNSVIGLHLFADTPEAVAFRLMEHDVPYEVADRRVRYSADRQELMPSYRFLAGDAQVEATVFPLAGLRQPPSCPVEGGPMRRARRPELEALLVE